MVNLSATRRMALCIAVAATTASTTPAQVAARADQPLARPYRDLDGRSLQLYIFAPTRSSTVATAAAVLLIHGGGWIAGSVDETFDEARRFAREGFVAIAVEYRLADSVVTPMEQLSDVCAAIKWTRGHAPELGVNPDRVAAYGVAAGGQLAAAAATIGCGNFFGTFGLGGPDALLLVSPAVDAAYDPMFVKLLQGRADPADYSPMQRMRVQMPPSMIVEGDNDTVTPPDGAKRFCDRIRKGHGRCELLLYKGVGHLLTRNLANQRSDADPDPVARDGSLARQVRFLKELWRR